MPTQQITRDLEVEGLTTGAGMKIPETVHELAMKPLRAEPNARRMDHWLHSLVHEGCWLK